MHAAAQGPHAGDSFLPSAVLGTARAHRAPAPAAPGLRAAAEGPGLAVCARRDRLLEVFKAWGVGSEAREGASQGLLHRRWAPAPAARRGCGERRPRCKDGALPDRVPRPPGTPASGVLRPARAARTRGRPGGPGQVTNACVSLGAGFPRVACTQHDALCQGTDGEDAPFGARPGRPVSQPLVKLPISWMCWSFGQALERLWRGAGATAVGCSGREALAGTRGLFWPM